MQRLTEDFISIQSPADQRRVAVSNIRIVYRRVQTCPRGRGERVPMVMVVEALPGVSGAFVHLAHVMRYHTLVIENRKNDLFSVVSKFGNWFSNELVVS